MKTLFSFLATVALIATLGGCHTAVRDPGSLATGCNYGNASQTCQVQAVIYGLYDVYNKAGWKNPKEPQLMPQFFWVKTGIQIVYECGEPVAVATPNGTYMLSVGNAPSVQDMMQVFQLMPPNTDLQERKQGPVSVAPYDSTSRKAACLKYGSVYFQVNQANGTPVPAVTTFSRRTLTPQPEE